MENRPGAEEETAVLPLPIAPRWLAAAVAGAAFSGVLTGAIWNAATRPDIPVAERSTVSTAPPSPSASGAPEAGDGATTGPTTRPRRSGATPSATPSRTPAPTTKVPAPTSAPPSSAPEPEPSAPEPAPSEPTGGSTTEPVEQPGPGLGSSDPAQPAQPASAA
jgi:hypothetical protein